MDKINNLFEKDSVIRIISVFMAIFIWFFVLDQENPFEERSLSVPLSSNIEVLQKNNLQLVGTQLPASIDVKIKGRRDKIANVTANDFKATIDLSGITSPGTQKIKINTPEYLGDEDILITSINPSYVTLTFERVIGKQYPVNVEFTGKLPIGYELVNLTIDPSSVILEELESSISKVDKVVAYVNLDEIGDNEEIIMRATALDFNGKAIKQFEGKIPVIIRFNLAKRVPVVATPKGEPADDFFLKEIRCSLPEVRVLGSKSILDGIKRVIAEPVDISGKSSSFITPLTLLLPSDVTVLKEDAEKLSAEVVLERYATRTINVPASQISIYDSDMSGNKVYRVSDDPIAITIKGRPEIINSVKATDIILSVHVNGFEQGEHEVPLEVTVPNNVILIGEYTVNITIEETQNGTPAPGESNQ